MMHIQGAGENEDVIQLNKEELVEVSKDVFDQDLEYCCGVGKPERHDQIFIMASWQSNQPLHNTGIV